MANKEKENATHISVKFFKHVNGRVRKVEFLHPLDRRKCADDNMHDAVRSAISMGYNPRDIIQTLWV